MIHELKSIRRRRPVMKRPAEPDNDDEEPNQWANLAALVFVACLIALSVWIANALHHHAQMQDCLMAGRTNCAPVAR
jgi:hypothetical protein